MQLLGLFSHLSVCGFVVLGGEFRVLFWDVGLMGNAKRLFLAANQLLRTLFLNKKNVIPSRFLTIFLNSNERDWAYEILATNLLAKQNLRKRSKNEVCCSKMLIKQSWECNRKTIPFFSTASLPRFLKMLGGAFLAWKKNNEGRFWISTLNCD